MKYRGGFVNVCAMTLVALIAWQVSAKTGFREVDMPDGWRQIFPGGETICARGEEFSFFYHPGTTNDLVIDFIGGGACWNYGTCNKETSLFVDSVDYVKERVQNEGLNGIYDHNNERNPVMTWAHVVVPYCTGDLHWGDNVQTYTNGNDTITINHKGAVNAQAVLDWTFREHNARQIFVTGTSAGGYASLYWLPYIKEHAPNASLVQFSDGAAGVVVKEPFQEALRKWNVRAHAPSWIPDLNPQTVNWDNLTIADFYTVIGRYYPTVTLSQFNTNLDSVQMLFYFVMGGQDPATWSQEALQSVKLISSNIENFQYFHAAGEFHTIIPENFFYTLSANNVLLVDWVQNMIDRANMGNIVCADCDPFADGMSMARN